MESGKIHMVNRSKEASAITGILIFITFQIGLFVFSFRRESEIFWIYYVYILLGLYYLIVLGW